MLETSSEGGEEMGTEFFLILRYVHEHAGYHQYYDDMMWTPFSKSTLFAKARPEIYLGEPKLAETEQNENKPNSKTTMP